MGKSIPFVRGLFEGAGDAVSNAGKPVGKASINDAFIGEKYEKVLGTEQMAGKNEDKKSEQYTERKEKSTHKAKNLIPEPSLFATDTIDFNYDLFEFANRTLSPTFLIRFEHSEVLFNNLTNNANLYSAPIKSIATPFKHFKELLTPGLIQGEIDLDWDTDDGFFAGLIRRGIPFIESKDTFFKPFKYRYQGLSSYMAKSISRTDVGQGEEEVEEIKKLTEEKVDEFDNAKAIAGYSTYFRTDTAELFNALCEAEKPDEQKFEEQNPAHAQRTEKEVNIRNNCVLVIDPIGGAIFVRHITTDYLYHFKAQCQDAERDEDIVQHEFEDTTHDPTNTSGSTKIEEDDNTEKDELDLDDDTNYEGEQEEEKDEEAKIDSDYDDEIDDNTDEDSELDTDIEDDDDSDEEEDSDDDDDTDDDTEDDTDTEDDDDNDDQDDNQDKGG
ncbi:hypothetical protein EV426DRAFT_571957 [Tirmania nivea]|nr:hypothetical protein EV426DRAFT_571957 [Tirmania nivea]